VTKAEEKTWGGRYSPTTPVKVELVVERDGTITYIDTIIGVLGCGTFSSRGGYHLKFKDNRYYCKEGGKYSSLDNKWWDSARGKWRTRKVWDEASRQYKRPMAERPNWVNDLSVLFNFLLTVPTGDPCFKWLRL
jgi:hypothetical protein